MTSEQAALTLSRASDRILLLEVKQMTVSMAVRRFSAEVQKDKKEEYAR